MAKVYIVDTNVILSNNKFYEELENDCKIIIPYTAIEELDKFKMESGYRGYSARIANKLINQISQGFKENKNNMTKIEDKIFTIGFYDKNFICKKDVLDLTINDDKIISIALNYKENNIEDEVVVLSNDTQVRSKILSLYNFYSVDAIEFDMDMTNDVKDFYKQFEYNVEESILAQAYENKLETKQLDNNLTPNTSVILITPSGKGLFRVTPNGKYIKKIRVEDTYKNGMIKPLNDGQVQFASMILDEDIKIKAVIGRTGSGKSLLSIAYMLNLLDSGKIKQIKIIKPVSHIGESVGFLKGTYEDKTERIKKSLYPIFEILGRNLDMMEDLKKVEFCIPEYERGMTYVNTGLIITEAQNLDSEIKALITRLDDTSYAIVEGDIRQTDQSYLSEKNNGLSKLIDRLDGQEFFGKIYLNKSERGRYLDIIDELL